MHHIHRERESEVGALVVSRWESVDDAMKGSKSTWKLIDESEAASKLQAFAFALLNRAVPNSGKTEVTTELPLILFSEKQENP